MYQKNKSARTQGFTLIELMLAMAFVGSLLVMISLITMLIMGLYNKGLTLKEVNQVSRVVVRDIQQSVASANAFKLQHDDGGVLEPPPERLQEANNHGVDYYSNKAGGRLCTGTYSYVWNTGAALASYNPRLNGYNSGALSPDYELYPIQFTRSSDGTLSPVRFIKKSDPSKALCRIDTSLSDQDRIVGAPEDFTNVFGAGGNELMLYRFSIETRSDIDVSGTDLTAVSTFYYVRMTLGTQAGDEEENLISGDVECKAPANAEYNEGEYCAINKIDFVARTGGLSR